MKSLEQAADAGAAHIAHLETETTDAVRPVVNVSYQTRRGALLFAMTGGKGGAESDGNETDEPPSADETCTGGYAEEEEELLEQRLGASRRNTGDSGANGRRRSQQSSGDAVFIISSVSFERLAKALRQTAKVLKDAASHDDVSIGIAKAAAFLGEPTSTWDLVFCLLCRYDAMCGPGPKEGGGFHSAVPYSVFDAISEVAGVGVESFASPLLTRGGKWKYCSCFGDLDVYFGSLGSFFDTAIVPETIGGTFEANPPFTEAVVDPFVEKVLGSLARASSTGTPLQFFVVLPRRSVRVCCGLDHRTVVNLSLCGRHDEAATAAVRLRPRFPNRLRVAFIPGAFRMCAPAVHISKDGTGLPMPRRGVPV